MARKDSRPLVKAKTNRQFKAKKIFEPDKEAKMKETLKQENSLYESPTIDVMQITMQDVVRTSPGFDDNIQEGEGSAGDWWE